MLFSEVLGSLAPRDGELAVSVPGDWMQGRSVFGGLQTALAVHAMRTLVPADYPLRAVQTTFIGPVEGAVRLRVQVLRTGKSVIHAEARILTGDQTAALIVGVFGRGRPSQAEVAARAPNHVPQGEPFDFSFVEGVSPAFLRHFAMRWHAGALLFTGARDARHALLEVGMVDAVPASECHVLAFADAPPPLALAMLSKPAPGSSVTWTMEFLVDRFDAYPLSGWRVHAELRAGRDGYTNQEVMVCAPDGTPVALSYQTMMVFG
jgi:acyl-CoA thioesterase